ncbi:MAG: lytic transglycosylase domain-containing protein [Bilifractor sp.]
MDRVESVALPYLNSPNYNYGTAIASTSTGNEIFENVMKQATISSMLNDESQGEGTASGGTKETSEQDDSNRYSEDLRKAWETLRAQEDAFYRTSQAARAARKPLKNTANSTFTSTVSASASGANASTAATAQTLTGAGASGTVAADTPYEVASDGTVSMEQIFQKAAAKYGVSSNLLKAVAKVESGYQPGVVSSAGAIGVMQLMPGTASSLGVTNAYDAEQNIMGGAKLLSQLLAQYNNNLDLALAAYNAGPGNVAKYGGAPPYTQKYISMIKSIMNSGEQTINVPVTIASTSASSSDLSVAASAAANLLSSPGSSGDGNTLGNLAKLAELQTLNSAASTFSSFGSDDDDSSLI